MESGLDLRAGWNTLPDQATEQKVVSSERQGTDLVAFQTPCSRG